MSVMYATPLIAFFVCKEEISTELGSNLGDVKNLLHAMDHDAFFYQRYALPERLQDEPGVPARADGLGTADAKADAKQGDETSTVAKPKAGKSKAKAKAKSKFQKERISMHVNDVLCISA